MSTPSDKLSDPKPSCSATPTKTWVDFTSLSEDVEKLEFPVPREGNFVSSGEKDHNSNQSEVFIGPLSEFNMVDQFEKSMLNNAVKLPRPCLF